MSEKKDKDLLKKCRHKAEIPITIVAIIITILFTILVVFLFKSSATNQGAQDFLINSLEYEETDVDFALKSGKYLIIVIILMLAIKLFWELFKNAGIAVVNDIPIEESYDSVLFKEYKEYCRKLGIEKIPEIYLTTDKENLESTGITIKSRKYLRLYLSIRDEADMFAEENIIRFEFLHELAHIAYHHYNYALLLATIVVRWAPILRSIYSRTMCYSADRLAAEILGKEECITVLLKRYLQSTYEENKREEYIKRLDRKLTISERISSILNNLTSDTPSYLYRIQALVKDDNKGRII